jgi:hypothetical protein
MSAEGGREIASFENRIAHNEAVFREINERLEAGHATAAVDEVVAFRCECGMLGCNMLVALTLREYEEVRADPCRFLLAPGHEIPGVEKVVRAGPGYNVVEKFGEAGRVADATDPRDD